MLVLTSLLVASCGDHLDVPGSLILGSHHLTGEFKVPVLDAPAPPPFPWSATVDVSAAQWCVSSLTIEGTSVSLDGGRRCDAIDASNPSAVLIGVSGRGSVYAVYAPGRRAVGVSSTGPTGDEGATTMSSAGSFMVVLLKGGGHETMQLLDGQRHSIDLAIN
jgi:hypothetical protein